MPALSLYDPSAPSRPPFTLLGTGGFRYPRSHGEWVERYSWLFDQYVGEPYTIGDIKQLGLFRALDKDGNVLAETRRVTRDVQHVVDTDASAIAKPLSLTSRGPLDRGKVSTGEAIWRRGRVPDLLRKWATESGAMGDYVVEAVWRSTGSRPVQYDPRWVRLDYDDEGIDLVKATITIPFFESSEGVVSAQGVPLEQPIRVYERTLTPTSVTVKEMDPTAKGGMVTLDERSYRHNLGVVPLAHVPFIGFGPPEHGLWAAHTMEEIVATIDSYMAQLRAISNRFANPILAMKGASLEEDSDVQKFGRMLANLPPDSDVAYVEPQLVIAQLWEAIQAFKADQRHTIPEFIFSGSGANTSGEALKLRASEFETKMEDVRGRFYGGLSRVTQMCAMLDDDATDFDAADLWYRIDAAPILPRDRRTWVELVDRGRSLGLLTRADGVRHLQGIGLIDAETDVDEYLQTLDAEPTDDAGDALGKLPLALQQLALARERSAAAGDDELATALGDKAADLTEQID